MIWKTVILLGLAAFVVGDGHATSEQKVIMRSKPQHRHHGDLKHYGSHKPEHHEEYAWSYPSYEFFYKVDDPHTNDKKGHQESREGDDVKGEYWLYEPDGRKRTVEYSSDKKTGFKAIVKYSAPHKHDHHEHKEHKHDAHDDKKEDDHHKKDHEEHHDDHRDEHHDNILFEIMKVHKDDDHKKDDHHDDEHHEDNHSHHDEKDQHKDEHRHHDTKQDDHDDKRGHSSQIMPHMEQYRPFPYRQASIQYDAPFHTQQYYRRNRKQY